MKNFLTNFLNNNQKYLSIINNYDITALGDKIVDYNLEDNYQLYRCVEHKKFEGELLLKLPKNYSFLDVGAHYGDTVITMALHAKNNNREDIRFFAFEPNNIKCEYIKNVSKSNNLNICVMNVGVGNENCKIIPYHYKSTLKGTITYKKDDNGLIDMITLDSIKEKLEPIGFIHIDVEGWESNVLKGSDKILNNENNKIFIIAECWDNFTSERLGFSKDPEKDIIEIMEKYKFIRNKDLIDQEKNLVFLPEN